MMFSKLNWFWKVLEDCRFESDLRERGIPKNVSPSCSQLGGSSHPSVMSCMDMVAFHE
jgi:hypothetical protein